MAHDILLRGGEIPIYASLTDDRTSLELLAQHLERRLRTFFGEWYLDVGEGLPYLEWVSVKPAPIDLITDKVRKTIRETPGVRAILSLTVAFDDNTRKVNLTGKVLCDVGIIDLTTRPAQTDPARHALAVPWVAVFAGVPVP